MTVPTIAELLFGDDKVEDDEVEGDEVEDDEVEDDEFKVTEGKNHVYSSLLLISSNKTSLSDDCLYPLPINKEK
jgi:hypothetical protein